MKLDAYNPKSKTDLWSWLRRGTPYVMISSRRYRGGFALLTRDDERLVAEGDEALRLPLTIAAARRAALTGLLPDGPVWP